MELSKSEMETVVEMVSRHRDGVRIAISGGRHCGKTTTLKNIYQQLQMKHIEAKGWIEKAVFDGGFRIGYDFEMLGTGDVMAVCRRDGDGVYIFNDGAWLWAELQLKRTEDVNVLLVDELGLLEAEGRGLSSCLVSSLGRSPRHLIASVRAESVEAMRRQIGGWDKVIWLS